MPTLLSDVRCWGQSGKHLLALSFSGFDPSRTSAIGHPGQPHALIDALTLGEVTRIVAVWVSAEATNGEIWLERQSGLRYSARLIQLPDNR